MLRSGKQKEAPAPRKLHIRKNDEVVVIAGKDRGKRGKVLRVIPSTGRAIVEQINFLKRHTRKNPGKNVQGGILEREAPISASNLMVVCPGCSKPTRVGANKSDEGMTRVCKNCEAELSR